MKSQHLLRTPSLISVVLPAPLHSIFRLDQDFGRKINLYCDLAEKWREMREKLVIWGFV